MVEMRVAVPDAAQAHGLLARLAALFQCSAVSFDGTHNEVRVCSEWESRSIVAVIDAVQSWLAADGVDSAKLSIGDRSYTMAGPALVPSAPSFLDGEPLPAGEPVELAQIEGATALVLR
jgi:hypothetical protein